MNRYVAIVILDLVASFGIAILGSVNGFEQIADGQFWQGLVTLQAMAAWLYGIDRLSKWAKAKLAASNNPPDEPRPYRLAAVARKVSRTLDRLEGWFEDKLADLQSPAARKALERLTARYRWPAPAPAMAPIAATAPKVSQEPAKPAPKPRTRMTTAKPAKARAAAKRKRKTPARKRANKAVARTRAK